MGSGDVHLAGAAVSRRLARLVGGWKNLRSVMCIDLEAGMFVDATRSTVSYSLTWPWRRDSGPLRL